MENTLISDAEQVIFERKMNAERESRQNKELALKDATFKGLYHAYVNKMIDEAKTGNFSDILKSAKDAYEQRLKKLNIKSIEPNYFCSKCQDTGYIQGRRCDCLKKEITNILMKNSGFKELHDFKDIKFDIFENPEKMKKVYDLMQQWCFSKFEKLNVLLSGETGVGKTYLATCMANEFIKLNYVVNFTTAFNLGNDFVRTNVGFHSDEQGEFFNKYIDCDILFIDDLGTELKKNNITNTCIHLILNERMTRKRPTVITTNLSLADIRDYYDERIYSRIADDSTIKIQIAGDDLRLKKTR